MSLKALLLQTAYLIVLILLPFLLPSGSSRTFFKDSRVFLYRPFIVELLEQEIRKTEPLDFLFVGSSTLERSVRPDLIDRHFKRKTAGREFRSYNANFPGGAGDLFVALSIIEAFLEKREVRVLFLSSDALLSSYVPPTVLNFNKEVLYRILPLMSPSEFLYVVSLSVLYAPLRLKNYLVSSRFERSPLGERRMRELLENKGAQPVYTRFKSEEEMTFGPYTVPFVDPKQVLHLPAEGWSWELLEKESDIDRSRFYLLRKIIDLCSKKGVKIYIISSPQLSGTLFSDERGHRFLPILEIPVDRLFKNLDQEGRKRFFEDPFHTNGIGARIFTEALLPTLEKIDRETAR